VKIAIYGQTASESTLDAVISLADLSIKLELQLYFELGFFNQINANSSKFDNQNTFTELDKTFNYLVSVGGDGTMLRSVTYIKDLNIPVIGINTGRLGFLATVQSDQIEEALRAINSAHYDISERSLLQIKTDPPHKAFDSLDFALNEITISRKDTTSMITVATYLNDSYLTSYWADGLIVSTPTGSTGYSLSCGGPVIMPEASNLVLTPIAPHNLNARPLVISDETKIRFTVNGREDYFLVSLDSRIATLHKDTILHIQKASFTIKMIELKHESFLDTLRKKLLWGEDKRN